MPYRCRSSIRGRGSRTGTRSASSKLSPVSKAAIAAKHGTGLGLAIVKGFAEAMGLSVEASNNDDPHGACFTIRIPERLIITHLDDKEQP